MNTQVVMSVVCPQGDIDQGKGDKDPNFTSEETFELLDLFYEHRKILNERMMTKTTHVKKQQVSIVESMLPSSI